MYFKQKYTVHCKARHGTVQIHCSSAASRGVTKLSQILKTSPASALFVTGRIGKVCTVRGLVAKLALQIEGPQNIGLFTAVQKSQDRAKNEQEEHNRQRWEHLNREHNNREHGNREHGNREHGNRERGNRRLEHASTLYFCFVEKICPLCC